MRKNDSRGDVFHATPYVDGALIIGDSGSLLDSQRLKGIHMASRWHVAAETIFEALKAGDTSAAKLSAFQKKVEDSYIKKIVQVRNFHQSFQYGLVGGLFHAGCSSLPEPRLVDPMRVRPATSTITKMGIRRANASKRRQAHLRSPHGVYHSGTRMKKISRVTDRSRFKICANRCTVEYGILPIFARRRLQPVQEKAI